MPAPRYLRFLQDFTGPTFAACKGDVRMVGESGLDDATADATLASGAAVPHRHLRFLRGVASPTFTAHLGDVRRVGEPGLDDATAGALIAAGAAREMSRPPSRYPISCEQLLDEDI